MSTFYILGIALFLAFLVVTWAAMIARINNRQEEEEHRVSRNPHVSITRSGRASLEVPDSYPDLPLPPELERRRQKPMRPPGTPAHAHHP